MKEQRYVPDFVRGFSSDKEICATGHITSPAT